MANDWRQAVDQLLELQASAEMNTEPGDGFVFFPEKWLGDQLVTMMRLDSQGAHIRLLALAWRGFDLDPDTKKIPCSIPLDEELLCSLVGNPESWDRIWPQLKRVWREHNGRLWCMGLVRSYLKQMQGRRIKKKAASARWDAPARAVQCRDHAGASSSDAPACETDAGASAVQRILSGSGSGSGDELKEGRERRAKTRDTLTLFEGQKPKPEESPPTRGEEKKPRAKKLKPLPNAGPLLISEPEVEAVCRHWRETVQPFARRCLGEDVPKVLPITETDRNAARLALSHHPLETVKLALDHVPYSAYLAGYVPGHDSPKLDLCAIAVIRPGGQKPRDGIGELAAKTKPDKLVAERPGHVAQLRMRDAPPRPKFVDAPPRPMTVTPLPMPTMQTGPRRLSVIPQAMAERVEDDDP